MRKDEVQGCFDGRSEETKEKTFSKVPVRTVGDIMFLKMRELASCLASLLGNRRNVNFVLFLGAACENGTCYAEVFYWKLASCLTSLCSSFLGAA